MTITGSRTGMNDSPNVLFVILYFGEHLISMIDKTTNKTEICVQQIFMKPRHAVHYVIRCQLLEQEHQ